MGEADGKKSGFATSEVFGRMVEIMLCGGFAAIDTIAEFDDIQVALHNAALAPNLLYESGVVSLKCLTPHFARMREEAVFGGLLAYGAGTGLFASTFVFEIDGLHAVDEEAMMIHVETAILGDGNRIDEMGRYVVEADIVAFKNNRAVGVFDLLEEALHHEGGDRGIEDRAEKHLKEGETQQRQERHPNSTPYFAEKGELTPPFQSSMPLCIVLFFLSICHIYQKIPIKQIIIKNGCKSTIFLSNKEKNVYL